MTGRLSSHIAGAAAKRLTAVEARPERSNQHELNGVQALKALFGDSRATRSARFVYLTEHDADPAVADAFVTWYDAREGHPTRSEFRLYFPQMVASEQLQQGDLALVFLRPDESVLVVFAARNSTGEQQLLWLLGLNALEGGVEIRDFTQNDLVVGFAAREVLAQLGIEPQLEEPADDSYLEILLDRFGGSFPPTSVFSMFAREVTTDVDPVADPDGALIGWLEREELLFRLLERQLVLQRIRRGFGEDVDTFIQFSLSVQNRRKSRVGYALEHHVQAVLDANGVVYSRAPTTERTSRPDFIFPSIADYLDPATDAGTLTMLAVKSTCKDRWRQVLMEADRVRQKHLLTLEPGISETQTQEMYARGVLLVVPIPIQDTYSPPQRKALLSVRDFLSLVTPTRTPRVLGG